MKSTEPSGRALATKAGDHVHYQTNLERPRRPLGAFDSGAPQKKPHSLSGRDRLTRRYSKQAANHCTRSTLERVFTSNQVPAGPLLPATTADKEWRC